MQVVKYDGNKFTRYEDFIDEAPRYATQLQEFGEAGRMYSENYKGWEAWRPLDSNKFCLFIIYKSAIKSIIQVCNALM